MRAKLPLVVAALLAAPLSVLAHHSFAAEFDANKPLVLKGTITRIDLVNPHAWLYMNVTNADGKTVNWAIEMGAPNGLIRRGISKNTLPIGAEITVEGFAAKDGTATANGRTLRMADGRSLFAGSSGTGAPGDPPRPAP
jgi:Family of unknown function (DUF6152)